ncbi:hypothetical protein JL721_10674 [Aureococcus anophagefferens]|nr:hypothetical protein JL721_10674 [Aureococcus anophagefferens]
MAFVPPALWNFPPRVAIGSKLPRARDDDDDGGGGGGGGGGDDDDDRPTDRPAQKFGARNSPGT